MPVLATQRLIEVMSAWNDKLMNDRAIQTDFDQFALRSQEHGSLRRQSPQTEITERHGGRS